MAVIGAEWPAKIMLTLMQVKCYFKRDINQEPNDIEAMIFAFMSWKFKLKMKDCYGW